MDTVGMNPNDISRMPSLVDPADHKARGVVTGNLRNSHNQLFARFITQMVAHSFNVDRDVIMRPERGNAQVARVRHIAIYLMHTKLSLGLKELGLVFGKDRTTMAYACRVIEDARDDLTFDARMLEFEQIVESVIALSLPALKEGNSNDVC